MALFDITITLAMEIHARSQEEAEQRGELLAEAATKGINDSPYRWKPLDIDPEVQVERANGS